MSRRQRDLRIADTPENFALLKPILDRAHIPNNSIRSARLINRQYVQLSIIERDQSGRIIIDRRTGEFRTYTKRTRIPRGHPWSKNPAPAKRPDYAAADLDHQAVLMVTHGHWGRCKTCDLPVSWRDDDDTKKTGSYHHGTDGSPWDGPNAGPRRPGE